MGDWLKRFHTLIGDEYPCDTGDEMRRNPISSHNVTNVTGISRPFSAPLDTEEVPCGGCPSCNQGEFWRWPRFHKEHKPSGWICWFCSPPPERSGPCDFCGVPDSMLGNANG
jgi:hypothetical protein